MIKLKLKKRGSNDYSGSDWNYELTSKYVFDINNKIVEAGYFIHYIKQKDSIQNLSIVKEVIELPSSQGCPIKCAYCASSYIDEVRRLSEDEIYQIFDYIYMDNKITGINYLLVTMTGIGDYSLCFNTINSVIRKINREYHNVHFTISSSIWTDASITMAVELSRTVDLRTINITYISYNWEKTKEIIKKIDLPADSFQRIVNGFNKTKLSRIRINYIMIKDVNDSPIDFDEFVRICEPIKEKLKIRISKLNNTMASLESGLLSADNEKLIQFQTYLNNKGFDSYLFYSYIDDHMNCGQLLTEGQNFTCFK